MGEATREEGGAPLAGAEQQQQQAAGAEQLAALQQRVDALQQLRLASTHTQHGEQ